MPTKRQLAAQERLLDKAFIQAALEALAYTAKWHGTLEWARAVCEEATGDYGPWPDASIRVERVRGSLVNELDYDDEAWRKGVPISDLMDWLSSLPRDGETGRRRTVIRILCWVVDRDSEVVYDPEWIKVGDDMSPRSAGARARRWARGYTEVLNQGLESREIIMTAIEIAFWTSPEKVKTV